MKFSFLLLIMILIFPCGGYAKDYEHDQDQEQEYIKTRDSAVGFDS